MTNHCSDAFGVADVTEWNIAECGSEPDIAKNASGSAVTTIYDFYLPPTDYLHLHPGPDGQLSTLRYTASVRGQYRIDAAFTSLRVSCGTTTDVHILRNGQSGLFDDIIDDELVVLAPDGVTPVPPPHLIFGSTLPLESGDTIDFAVGYGLNFWYGCDSTGLKATIVKTNGVIPPIPPRPTLPTPPVCTR
ncbi:MAG: hypothetical protein PHD43_13315 [Methylococcales bacterium]|nr:hypothetical protein [Methylococcales bacterium]